jgi:hypothetical protein
MRELERIRKGLEKHPDKQLSLTDPDSRSMTSDGKSTGRVGCNVQAAMGTKPQHAHHQRADVA